MFSNFEKEVIESSFNKRREITKPRELDLFDVLEECSDNETICLKYLYAYMPLSDMASYAAKTFLQYVRHALMVRNNMPWGKSLPADIFLNYVLHYRVNNENIEGCRSVLFNEIFPLIKDKDMFETAIEVNYWCLGKATYRLTDDRTASPLTIIRNAYGRCGEESVLTVTAMRSVGIPARQCYVPRWSHCDDNHAWVEVWIDGKWEFVGACEPEPVLNKGWFTSAASKAMLVHSRVFSTFIGEAEKVQNSVGLMTTVNNLKTYAKTAILTVKVIDSHKRPVQGVTIRFEVLNYSELYPIAVQKTSSEGQVSFLTGLGDLFIHACKDGLFINRKVDVRKEKFLELDFSKALSTQQGILEFDMFPPEENLNTDVPVSDDSLKMHEAKIENEEKARHSYESTFFTPDAAIKHVGKIGSDSSIISEYLINSRGNYREMLKFITNSYSFPLKLKLLSTLTIKDYTDMREEILNEHLSYSEDFEGNYDDEIFTKYILSPRIGLEYIGKYRDGILGFFGSNEKASFTRNPTAIYEYIEDNIKDSGDYDYKALISNPAGLLKLGIGSKESKKILFVAICRTLGIPSRLNPITGEAEYYRGTDWISSFEKACCEENKKKKGHSKLILIRNKEDNFIYMQNFSIGKLEEGAYRTLDCSILNWKANEFVIDAASGAYRIVTSIRQIDGSILARSYHIELKPEETMSLNICLRENQLKERLKQKHINDFVLISKDGLSKNLSEIVFSHSASIAAVLDVGKEPTEHLLNEIFEMKEQYIRDKVQIVFIVNSEADFEYGILKKVINAIPSAKAFMLKTKTFMSALFREVEIGDHRLPLSMVLDAEMNAKFAFSNYNVGTAELLLQIVKA